MKNNAITRIVLWSIVIVLLSGFLVLTLLGDSSLRGNSTLESIAAVPLTEPTVAESFLYTATVKNELSVRSSPSEEASIVAAHYPGDIIEISQTHNVGGKEWGFSAVDGGWILMEHVSISNESTPTIDSTQVVPSSATVSTRTKVYPTSNLDSDFLGVLNVGVPVEISYTVTVNGTEWAYIVSPETGWVLMETLTLDDSVPTATAAQEVISAEPIDGSALTYPADQITTLEIEWVAGNIVIQPADVTNILVSESGVTDEKYVMRCKQKGEKLTIQFSEDTVDVEDFIGINIGRNYTKDLTILVPLDWQCDSLELDAASAALEVSDLTIREVEIDTASGTCDFNNCTVEKVDLDTASGDVYYTGSLNILECDAASASVYAKLYNIPTRVDMDSMSGDLDIALPEDAGFTVTMDAMSSDFSSDFETTTQNGSHIHGDGACRINMDAMSGDVIVRRHTAEPHHQHTDECTTNPESCPLTASTTHHEETNHE